ncbi:MULTISPECIES: hypothetical protein [unclassified Janthinobacterium]|uniref:hypothetical protein n=1 Tax=unclassified Janthinobacterium TaxID=2610881 RepID=UPI001607C8D1|nr:MULTISPECIES: hypothetical protein [unclassified Janthinobacterium]MBB5606453.1 hypothetical protein [Janthinobacterium sp. S3T4]MBB5611675.1 hypothetical protein [Janthinobacterium sp. S3M3]
MDIQLNFINRSYDQNNSSVFLFQKNAASRHDELATAWKVIRNCGQNSHHPLVYSTDLQACISDEYGNYSPRKAVRAGELLTVSALPSGRRFAYAGANSNSLDTVVRNDLLRGAINVCVYSQDRLLATKTNVAPGQKAIFQFQPTLWIGAAAQVVEGRALSSAILNDVNTEFSLQGIASADIVMSGGGPGRNALPLQFTLENIAMA